MKTATLVLIVRNGAVLLAEKKRGEIGTGTLNGPGGKLDEGETLAECAVRETREELGIELDPARLEEVARIVFHVGGVPDFDVHVFRTDSFAGALHETDDMWMPQWYPLDAVPYDRMLESDRSWMAKALAGEKFAANAYYRERAKGFERIEFLPSL